jgi:hypothetical protein
VPSWWQYDFGASNAKRIGKLRIEPNFNRVGSGWGGVGNFLLQGSNDGSNWTQVGSYTHGNNQNFEDFLVPSPTQPFRYWRINVQTVYSVSWASICEVEMYEFL